MGLRSDASVEDLPRQEPPGDGRPWGDALLEGTLREGTFQEGTLQEGTLREGTFQEGTFQEGTLQEGTLQEGRGGGATPMTSRKSSSSSSGTKHRYQF